MASTTAAPFTVTPAMVKAYDAIATADKATRSAEVAFLVAIGCLHPVPLSAAHGADTFGPADWNADAPASRLSLRALAIVLVPHVRPDAMTAGVTFTGYAGSNLSAADKAHLAASGAPGELAYWTAVDAVTTRLVRACDGIRPKRETAPRGKRPGAATAATDKAADKAGKAPATAPTAAALDASAITDVIQKVAARKRVPGITRDGANAIIAAAQTAAGPAPVVAADLDPAVVAQALALMVKSGYRSDALVSVCREYVAAFGAVAASVSA